MKKSSPKHIPKDILERVLKLRNEMLIKPDSNNKFSLGKLAFDTFNKEFGFVIGPIELEKDIEKIKRALLVTLGEEGPRVRYVRVNNLKVYDDVKEGVDDLNSVLRSDVYEFCNNLCIHECSDECILYKYKL